MSIKEEVQSFLEQNEKTQADVARALNMKPSRLSQVLNGTYSGDLEGDIQKIRTYIETYQGREKGCDTLLTHGVFEEGYGFLKRQSQKSGMYLLLGQPGSGKTTIVKRFCKDYPSAILIEGRVSLGSSELMQELATSLGLDASRKRSDKLLIEISTHLKRRESIIIIDEGEYLKPNSLELVRRIYDFSETPIFLVGTERLLENLRGPDSKHKQLFSRIRRKHTLRPLRESEVADYFQDVHSFELKHDAVRKISVETGGNYRLTANLAEAMTEYSDELGNRLGGNQVELVALAIEDILI